MTPDKRAEAATLDVAKLDAIELDETLTEAEDVEELEPFPPLQAASKHRLSKARPS